MNPVVVSRNESECVLVEGSVNSVRLSVKVKKADDLEDFLAKKFMRCAVTAAAASVAFHLVRRFLSQRAESFVVLRRKPIAVRVGRRTAAGVALADACLRRTMTSRS